MSRCARPTLPRCQLIFLKLASFIFPHFISVTHLSPPPPERGFTLTDLLVRESLTIGRETWGAFFNLLFQLIVHLPFKRHATACYLRHYRAIMAKTAAMGTDLVSKKGLNELVVQFFTIPGVASVMIAEHDEANTIFRALGE